MNEFKNKNIFQSFQRAFEGLIFTYKNHKHFKLEIIIAILVLIFSFILKINLIEWLFVLSAIFIFFFSEILNTTIEELANFIENKFDRKIKVIKDTASSLVLVMVFYSLSIGLIIFLPKILKFFK